LENFENILKGSLYKTTKFENPLHEPIITISAISTENITLNPVNQRFPTWNGGGGFARGF
jgi:hypothetical protein